MTGKAEKRRKKEMLGKKKEKKVNWNDKDCYERTNIKSLQWNKRKKTKNHKHKRRNERKGNYK